MSDPVPDDLLNEAGKQEIIHRNKGELTKVTYMWMGFLAPAMIGLAAILTVGALNIPSFTAANVQITETMATMHPWVTNSYPSWSIYEEANSTETPNRYLNMEFVQTTFMQRIFDLGWQNVGCDIMVRVRVPNATEGEPDIRYYSPWIATSQRVLPITPPAEGEEVDRTYTLRFSQHNLPPLGAPDGVLTSGVSYQAEIRLLMGTEDGTFFREYQITTDWYDYVETP